MANVALNIVVGGEEKAKQAIKELNGNIKQLGTNMKSLDEVFAGNQNSYDYLSAKLKNLTEAQEAYRKKTEILPGVIEYLRKEQNKLADKTDDLKQKMEQATAAYDNAENKTAALKRAMNEATQKFNDNQKALNHARNAANDYSRQLTEAEGKVDVLGEEIRKANGYLKEAAVSADGTATSIDRYGKEAGDAAGGTIGFSDAVDMLSHVLVASGVAKGVEKLKDIMVDCAKASIEFESAFAGVEKTVDGTDEELEILSDGIKNLATVIPLTTTELAKIAETAGQLGVAKGDILTFTEVTANLAATTDLSAEQAAVSLARIANITGLMTHEYSNFGSTLVDLGNNSAAFESEILEMTNRLAGTGSIVEATNAQLLGIATTLVSLGIEAEAGGTAFSKLLTNIELAVETGSNKVQQYAEVAGMSVEQFSDAWRNDAVKAVSAFIDGLGDLDSQGKSAIVVLDDMGISEVRLRDTILKLTEADGLLTENLELSNSAWKDNNALTEEAEKRYGTTESKLTLAKTAVNNLKIAIGDELLSQFDGFIGKFTDLITAQENFIRKNPDVITGLTKLKKALGINTELVEASDAADGLVSSLQNLKKEYVETSDAAIKLNAFSETKRLFESLSKSITDYDEKIAETSKTLSGLREERDKLLEQQNETYEAEMAAAQTVAALALQIESEEKNLRSYTNIRNAFGEQRRQTAEDLAIWEAECADAAAALEEVGEQSEIGANKTADAMDKLIGELRAGASDIADFVTDINEAIRVGFDEGLIRYLHDGGKETQAVISQIVEQFQALEAEYGKGSEEARTFVEEWNSAWTDMAEGKTALTDFASAGKKAAEEAEAAAKAAAKEAEQATKQAAKEAEQAAKEAAKASADAIKEQADKVKGSLDDLVKEYDSVYKSAKSSLEGSAGMFEPLVFESDKTVTEMNNIWRGQADYFDGYLKNLQRMVDVGFSDAVVSKFSDGSKESTGYAQTIVDNLNKIELKYGKNSEEAQNYVKEINESYGSVQTNIDKLATFIAERQTNFTARKDQILLDAEELLSKLNTYTGESFDEVEKAVKNVYDEVQLTLGSTKTAVEEKGGDVVDAFGEMREDIDKTFEGTEEVGEEAGENYVKGLERGVLKNLDKIKEAGKKAAWTLVDSVDEQLQINSPSKVGEEQGKFYDLGIAKGILDNGYVMVDGALKAIKDLEAAAQKAARAAGESIGGTIASAAAQEAGRALREMAEKGELTYNGSTVGTAASAGIPNLSGQEAADWNAKLKAQYNLPSDWTNQDIVDWLNGGGFMAGGSMPSVSGGSVSNIVSQATSSVKPLLSTSYIDRTPGTNSFYYGKPGDPAPKTVVVNQTVTTTAATPSEVRQAAKDGAKAGIYYV